MGSSLWWDFSHHFRCIETEFEKKKLRVQVLYTAELDEVENSQTYSHCLFATINGG
jgi:hypothetical protein